MLSSQVTSLVYVILISKISALNPLPHESCKVQYKKLGCFSEKTSLQYLFSDRGLGSNPDEGHLIDWKNWPVYIHSLACRCRRKAEQEGFSYFALRYFGLCYGANSSPNEDKRMGKWSCLGPVYKKPCNDSASTECVGRQRTEYFYQVDTNGGYGNWSTWSTCSTNCSSGFQVRTRLCNNPEPKGNGKDCKSLGTKQQKRPCNNGPCPINGGYTEWSAFGQCSKSCGNGIQIRRRSCRNPSPAHGGRNCSGPAMQSKNCTQSLCPVNGGYTEWSAYGPCSHSCGSGIQIRSRSCTNPRPAHGGENCYETDTQTRDCSTSLCPVDGGFSGWSSFGSCSQTCGGGLKKRTRSCTNPSPSNGGKDCNGTREDTKPCVNDLCKGIEGIAKSQEIVEAFLVNFHKKKFPGQRPSAKFFQAIFVIQKAVAEEFSSKDPTANQKPLETRLKDLRNFLKVAALGGSIDFARATLGKSLFVFMKKNIEDGLAVDNLESAAEDYLDSIKKDIGSQKFDELISRTGDTTLMFAIDTTGSMTEEINAAKAIAKAIINQTRDFDVDYILSPFNDPGYGPVTHSSEKERAEFVTAIDTLKATGGGDCPELTFTGMLEALRAGPKHGSPMFVFTDVSAKDDTKLNKDALKDAVDITSTTINFFTNFQGCGVGITSYEEIASYSSGQIFPLKNETELRQFTTYVQSSLQSDTTLAIGGNRKSISLSKRSSDLQQFFQNHKYNYHHKIRVDDGLDTVTISLNVHKIDSTKIVQLYDPFGRQIDAMVSLAFTKVYQVKNPEVGTWTLAFPFQVGLYEFTAHGISKDPIEFAYYFIYHENTTSYIVSNPLSGEDCLIAVQLGGDHLERSSLKLNIIDESGKPLLRSLALDNIGHASDILSSSFKVPVNKFKVTIEGKTKSGSMFQRVSRGVSHAQKAFMRVLFAGNEFTTLLGNKFVKIKIHIFNKGAPENFHFQFSPEYGSMQITGTNTQVISGNAFLTFYYHSPSNALYRGKTERIVITATGMSSSTNISVTVKMLLI